MKRKINAADVIITVVLCVWGLIILYPFYNSILVSLVPQQVYIKTPFLLYPPVIDLSSYQFVFSSETLMSGMRVTVVILIVGVVYNMLLTVITAYALTKPIPGQKAISSLIIFTLYFNGGLVPMYLLMQQLHLIDNIAVMILPMGISVPYLLIIRRNIEELPSAIEEAAKIDGANEMVILFRIILPLITPILATFALYYGVERWNEWYNGMMFIKDIHKMPLQTVLRNIVQDIDSVMENVPDDVRSTAFSDGVKMASIIVTMLPVMCLYPFLQKYFVSGVTAGAVKS